MRATTLLLATVSLVALAGAADAADLARRAPPPPPPPVYAPLPVAYGWDGGYVGIGAGYEDFTGTGTLSGDTEYLGPFSTPADISAKSGLFALYGGYNVVAPGGMLWGAELLGSYGKASSSTLNTSATFDWSIVPALRLGMVSGNFMFYGKAGWEFTRAKLGINDNGVNQLTDQGSGINSSRTTWINGPQVGVGVEVALAPRIRLGVEGDYTWYDTASVSGTDPNNSASTATYSAKPREVSGLVRLTFGY